MSVTLRKTKEIRANLGNYEHAIITATVETEVVEGADVQFAADSMDTFLDNWIKADIDKLTKVNGNTDSVIEHWEDFNG